MTLRAFGHDCNNCKYLGTHQEMYPPFPGGEGPFMVPRADFYRCDESGVYGVSYVARYGNSPTDLVKALATEVDDWRLVPMIRGDPSCQDDMLRMMIKIIRLVDSHDRLSKGYALVRLEDRPSDAFLLTVPFLMPHEQRLMLEVAPPLMNKVKGHARNRGVMKTLDKEIERRIHDLANKQGYLTIWNSGSFAPPLEGEDEERGLPN